MNEFRDNNEHNSENFPPEESKQREPMFNLSAVVILFASVCVLIHLVRTYLLSADADFELVLKYAFIPYRYTGPYPLDLYAFLGPVTYAFLHGSALHLFINLVWLAAFGSPLANRIGASHFAFLWLVTGLVAALFHFIFHSDSVVPVIGASGAISGMMGAAARFAFRSGMIGDKTMFVGPVLPIKAVLHSRTTVVFLAVWFVINIVVGLGFGSEPGGPGIAWEAHIGGMVAGFFLMPYFDPLRRRH